MTDRPAKVYSEQIRAVYSQYLAFLFGTPLACLVMALIVWSVTDHYIILAWLSYGLGLVIARSLLYRAFHRATPADDGYRRWCRWFQALLFLSGCIWGSASLFLFPAQPREFMVIMAFSIVALSAAGGITSYLIHYPTMLVFFIPVVLPGTMRLFAVGDRFHFTLGAAVVVYSLVVVLSTRRVNRALVKAIETNLELESEVAERKRVEEALARGNQQLRLITDNIPACIAMVDAEDLKYQFVNRQHLERFGHTWDQIVGHRVSDILGPDLFAFAKPYIDRALSGEPASYVNRFTLQDGPSWVNVNYVPYTDESGRVTGLVVLTHDVTAAKRAEEAIKQSEEQHRQLYMEANEARELYRSLLESTPDSIVIYDLQGRVTFVNDAFIHTFGWTLDEVTDGVPYTPESEREITRNNVLTVTRQGEPVSNFETTRLTKDGGLVEVSISASRFYDHLGHPAGMLVILRDISARVQMQRQLEEAKEAAESANRAKSAFLANISHELRTPLNAILGFSQLMAKDPGTRPEQRQNLAIIGRSGEHLLGLINDVLSLSKIEAGRTELQPEVFDLHHMLQVLVEMFRLRAEQKRLTLVVRRDPGVPRFIHADQYKLRQVLINLLGNAVKFTEKGEVTLRIDSHEAPPGTGRRGDDSVAPQTGATTLLHVEVEDTGPGIAAGDLDGIFQPFTQAGDARRQRSGTGLGLAITRQFVQMMGGDIDVDSREGHGACFRLDVRVEPVEGEQIPELIPSFRVTRLEPGQVATDGRRYRVLVADDHLDNRTLLRKILERAGFEVQEAVDGRQAVEVAAEFEPHLIWMDVRMPGLDGYEAAERIRSRAAAAKAGAGPVIIAVTASAFEDERSTALASGCDDFVTKPFTEATIFETMKKHLGLHYVREDEEGWPRARGPGLGPEDMIAKLASMEPQLLTRLEEATELSDMDGIKQAIDRIGRHDPALSTALTGMVDVFDYEGILTLVRRARTEEAAGGRTP